MNCCNEAEIKLHFGNLMSQTRVLRAILTVTVYVNLTHTTLSKLLIESVLKLDPACCVLVVYRLLSQPVLP